MIPKILEACRPSPVIRSALALMLSAGGMSVLGVLFWGVATHLFSVTVVGRASAEVAALTLIANASELNLSSAFVRFLPEAGVRTRAMILLSYLGCGTLAALGAAVFLLTPLHVGIVPDVLWMELPFAASVVLWTIFILQDAALTGLRNAAWVPVENISFGAAKLALLPLLAAAPLGEGVFFSWTMPMVLAVVGVNVLLFWRIVPARYAAAVLLPVRPLPRRRTMFSFLSAEYLSSLVTSAATVLMPLLIIKRLGSRAEGYFYLPWLMGTSFAGLLWSINAPLIAEISHGEAALPDLVRRSVRLIVFLVVPATLITVLSAPLLLGMLSHRYATHGTTLLRLVGATFPFSSVISLFVTSLWIRKQIWQLFFFRALLNGALIGLSLIFIGPFGLNAPGVADVAVLGTLGLATLPSLMRWRRSVLGPPASRGGPLPSGDTGNDLC